MQDSKFQKLPVKKPYTSPSNPQAPYLFNLCQALWNIVDSSLPDTVKIHASSAVGGFSFWTQFEAHMTDCNNKRQFALCISGYRGNKRNSVGDFEEQYPLHVGKCKAKKVKAGKLRIKLKSEMFTADNKLGETDLVKDIEFTGNEIDAQFSCFLHDTVTSSVPELEIFGKVFITHLDEDGQECDEFSFNLIKKNKNHQNHIFWEDSYHKNLADLLSADKCFWNRLALNLGYQIQEARLKFGQSKEPVAELFQDYTRNRRGDQQTFFASMATVAGFFSLEGEKYDDDLKEVTESQHVGPASSQKVITNKRQHNQAFISNDDTSLEEHELDDIARRIQRHWRHVGRQLNLPQSTLTEIDLMNSGYNTEREKAFQMLMEWRERYPGDFKKGPNVEIVPTHSALRVKCDQAYLSLVHKSLSCTIFM